MSVGLAKKVDAVGRGPFADLHFTPTQIQQIEYAGVLHDFGKVGVREKVLVKAKKLYEEDLRAVKLRFAFIKKALEAEFARTKAARGDGADQRRSAGAVRRRSTCELGRRMDEVDEALAFVARVNEPTVLEQGGFERLVEIAQLVYMAPDGQLRPYLEPEEVAALQVRRGSLTDVERVEIESHVDHTATSCARSPGAGATPTSRGSPARTTST